MPSLASAWGVELGGILVTRHGGDALSRYPEVMCAAVPELARMRGFDQHSVYHAYDVYEHTARVLTVAGELSRFRIDWGDPLAPPSPSLMWAALLHDVGKPSCFTQDESGRGHFYGHPESGERIARDILGRLAVPGEVARDACLLIRYHDTPLRAERQDLLRMMGRMAGAGRDTARLMGELFDLKRADTLGKAPSVLLLRGGDRAHARDGPRAYRETESRTAPPRSRSRARDLIAAGVAPGPRIGQMLSAALDAAILRRGAQRDRGAAVLARSVKHFCCMPAQWAFSVGPSGREA